MRRRAGGVVVLAVLLLLLAVPVHAIEVLSEEEAYREYARWVAVEEGLDPDVFERLIETESQFNPHALSRAGAAGIAQLIPRYHPGVDAWEPFGAMRYAARLLAEYKERFGSMRLALAAYNAGPGAVISYRGVPPYGETRYYVEAILGE